MYAKISPFGFQNLDANLYDLLHLKSIYKILYEPAFSIMNNHKCNVQRSFLYHECS